MIEVERKLHRKRRAAVLDTFYPDAPAMQRHQFFDQVQPDAQAADRRIDVLNAMEAFKDVRSFTFWYTDTVIFDPDHGFHARHRRIVETDLDRAALGTIFDGILSRLPAI